MNLEKENKKLKEMIEFKSDMVSMMAHQLRTSLSASKWVLKMLLDEDLGKITEEQKVFIKKTYESNEKMICLVSEMIDINQQEDMEVSYNFKDHDLSETIDDVITDFSGEAKERKVTIHFKKPAPIHTTYDEDKIKTAIQGLIENAIKYNKENGDIFVEIEDDSHDVTISIRDTGIGIAEEEKENIFNKFFRTKKAKKKENIGSGLGLFAVKSIVGRHKGKIWFESIEGVGSTFFITLPKRQS